MKEGEMAVPLTRRRFTVDEYSRMADAGILSEDDRVELIEGEIAEMVPIGARHAGGVTRLNYLFSRLVGERAIVIADTSGDYDRSIKVPLYARHRVPEVWVIDLQRDLVEVYRDPAPNGYREIRVARRGDRLTPLALPDVALSVDDILL